jgi:hypothetical protein
LQAARPFGENCVSGEHEPVLHSPGVSSEQSCFSPFSVLHEVAQNDCFARAPRSVT